MEHRKFPRLNTTGMEVSIADRVGFSTGLIKDISRYGICITDLPRKLQPVNNSVTVVVSAKGQQFRLLLKPQWEKQEGVMVATGTVINDVPRDWTTMVMQLEHQKNDAMAPKPFVSPQKRSVVKTLRRGVVVLK